MRRCHRCADTAAREERREHGRERPGPDVARGARGGARRERGLVLLHQRVVARRAVACPVLHQLHRRMAREQPVAWPQHARPVDAHAVHVRAVPRAEVLDHQLPRVASPHARVHARDLGVAAQRPEGGVGAADHQLAVERDAGATLLARDDVQQLSRHAAQCSRATGGFSARRRARRVRPPRWPRRREPPRGA